MRPLFLAALALLAASASAQNRAGESAPMPSAPSPSANRRTPTGPSVNPAVPGGGLRLNAVVPGASVNPAAASVPPAGAADAEPRPAAVGAAAVTARPAGPVLHGAAQDPGAALMREGATGDLGKTQTAVKAGTAAGDDGAALGAFGRHYDNALIRRGFAPEGGWPAVGARDSGVAGRVAHLTKQGDANVPDSPSNALGLYRAAIKIAIDAFKGKSLSAQEAEALTAKVVEHARARTESVRAADGEAVVPGALERYVALAYEAAQRGDAKAVARLFERDIPEWEKFIGAASRPSDLKAVREDVERVLRKEAHPVKVRFRAQDGAFAAVGLPERGPAAPGSRLTPVPATLPASLALNGSSSPEPAAEAGDEKPQGLLASAARKARRESVPAAVIYLASVLARSAWDFVFAPGLSEKRLRALERPGASRADVLALDLGPVLGPSAAHLDAVAAFHKKVTGSSVAVEAAAQAKAAYARANAAERRALESADVPGGPAYYARLFAQASLDRLDDEAAHAAKKRGLKALAYADRGMARVVSSNATPAQAAALSALGFQTELKGSDLRAWREGAGASDALPDALAFLNGRDPAGPDAQALARAVEAALARPQSRLPLRLTELPPLRGGALVRTARREHWVEYGRGVIALFEPGSRRFEGAYPLAAAR